MKKILLYSLLLAALGSCRALKDSPKYKLTDGVYKSAGSGGKTTVYIENEEDTVLVYTLAPDWKTARPNSKRAKPQVFPRGGTDKEVGAARYWKTGLDVDVFTIPFKYRPTAKDFTPQLSNHLNGAVYLGYRRDTYELSYKSNPIGKLSQRITHFGFSGGIATGIGVTPMNPWVTEDQITSEYDGFIWSKAICVLIGVEKLNFGLALGIDHLLDSNREYWIYQGKPYLGLTVGLNLN
jgi:hypothetical protein